MNIIDQKVIHNKLGIGTIIKQEEKRIIVRFDSGKESTFVYPDCFSQFLKLQDDKKSKEIIKEIDCQEKAKKADNKQPVVISPIEKPGLKPKAQKNSVKHNSVTEFCNGYSNAVFNEVSHLKKFGGKRQHLFDGTLVEILNGVYVYSFQSEIELSIPSGTDISLFYGDPENTYTGSIVDCYDFTVIVATVSYLGKETGIIEFSCEPWQLYTALTKRLTELKDMHSAIVHDLVCEGRNNIDKTSAIIRGSDNALKMSSAQPITFIWGPPGTGKTQTLAKIALEHISQGKRVLMVSYSNVSVDEAILRVASLSGNSMEVGTCVRYGYARKKEFSAKQNLLSYQIALQTSLILKEKHDRLLKQRMKTDRNTPEFVSIAKELNNIRKQLKEKERAVINNARFISTTVSKAIVDEVIYKAKFDTVIFDEASMAYVPQIIFAASLAKKHFVCMGDFKQLPPIVQGSSESILNHDVFEYCGITNAVENKYGHKWLCMLDVQHRMHPDISHFCSINMYHGYLTSADNMAEKRESITSHAPFAGRAISLVDLSGMRSMCIKTSDESRINLFSALIDISLAIEAAKEHEVGIITPYNAQSRLLNAMVRDISSRYKDLHEITCATVHQFQGSEKDVIIYDVVDCYRMPYPGMLISLVRNAYADRLFNVAMTRAKGKFIAVANVDYFLAKELSKKLLFSKLMDTCKLKHWYIKGDDVLHECINSNILIDSYNAEQRIINDLQNSRASVNLDLLSRSEEKEEMNNIGTVLVQKNNKGVEIRLRAESMNDVPSKLKKFATGNSFLSDPVMFIDNKVLWFNQPERMPPFIAEGKEIPIIYKPVFRFGGDNTVRVLKGFLGISNINRKIVAVKKNSFSEYIAEKKTCPECDNRMIMKKNDKGVFYLSCSNYPSCKHTERITVEMVDKYLYRSGGTGQKCPKCKTSLEARLGKKGVYVSCFGSVKHFYGLDEI